MKRFGCFLALLALCAAGALGTACAENAERIGNFECRTLEDGTFEITAYLGDAESLDIPETLDGRPVTSLADGAFATSFSLYTVRIPNGIIRVEGNPFYDTGLRGIEVADDHPALCVIDGALFDKNEKALLCFPDGRRVFDYTVPEGTLQIGEKAFYSCLMLQTVDIPESVTRIEDDAFNECELQSVSVPHSVTFIGTDALGGVNPMGTLFVERDSYAERYAKENGMNYVYFEVK